MYFLFQNNRENWPDPLFRRQLLCDMLCCCYMHCIFVLVPRSNRYFIYTTIFSNQLKLQKLGISNNKHIDNNEISHSTIILLLNLFDSTRVTRGGLFTEMYPINPLLLPLLISLVTSMSVVISSQWPASNN